MTVSGEGWATSMSPPPLWAHLPLIGVTWPCRSCRVIDTGGAGAAVLTVTATAPPAGATAFSWAETAEAPAAKPTRPSAR